MLKLMKYDFQKYWMQYIVLFLVYVICLTGIRLLPVSIDVTPFIQIVCLVTGYVALLAVYIIFLKNNFGSLFDKNSALLQTLPLTHHEILLCKVIEGMMLIFMGMFVLTMEAVFHYHCFQLSPGHADSFYVFFYYDGQPLSDFLNIYQFMDILIKIIVLTMTLLTVYAIWTLQHTSYHRIIKICVGIFVAVVSFVFFILANPHPTLLACSGFAFPQYVGYAIVFYGILCILLYILIKYLLDHKLEL